MTCCVPTRSVGVVEVFANYTLASVCGIMGGHIRAADRQTHGGVGKEPPVSEGGSCAPRRLVLSLIPTSKAFMAHVLPVLSFVYMIATMGGIFILSGITVICLRGRFTPAAVPGVPLTQKPVSSSYAVELTKYGCTIHTSQRAVPLSFSTVSSGSVAAIPVAAAAVLPNTRLWCHPKVW